MSKITKKKVNTKNPKRKDHVILRRIISLSCIKNLGIVSVTHTFKNLLTMGIEQVDSKRLKNMKVITSRLNLSRKMNL